MVARFSAARPLAQGCRRSAARHKDCWCALPILGIANDNAANGKPSTTSNDGYSSFVNKYVWRRLNQCSQNAPLRLEYLTCAGPAHRALEGPPPVAERSQQQAPIARSWIGARVWSAADTRAERTMTHARAESFSATQTGQTYVAGHGEHRMETSHCSGAAPICVPTPVLGLTT